MSNLNKDKPSKSNLVLYESEDGRVSLNVAVSEETVCCLCSRLLFFLGTDKSVISRHIGNIFKNNGLEVGPTVAKFATVQNEGDRQMEREIDYFNLDMVISIGYRVNSKEGIRFRKWATQVPKII